MHSTANRLTADHARREEAVQAARVAIWENLKRHNPDKGSLPAFLTSVMLWRMRDAAWSMPRDIPMEELPARIDEQIVTDIELAYHHGEIHQAIRSLTHQQQRYVYLRFWRGKSHGEMTPDFGYEPGGLWYSEQNGARWKLKATLSHLRDS